MVTPKIHKHKVQAYSEEELRTLLRLADQYAKPLLKLEIYLAIGSGCRRSEMAAIQIEDIDFKNKVLSVNKSRTYCGSGGDFLGPTKTEAGNREIPLPDVVCSELKKAVVRYNRNKLKQGKEFNDSRFIFSDEKGNPHRTASLSNWFTRFLKKHSEIRYLPLHAAGRHSYASLAVAQGTDIKAVQELLGHADISTTLNIYASSYEKSKKQQADKLNECIFREHVI